MRRVAHHVAATGGLPIVAGQEYPGRRDDLDAGAAQAVAHRHLGPDQARRDRVRIALEGHEGRRTDGVVVLDRRRVAGSREGPEALEFGQVTHARTLLAAGGEERDGGLLADQLLQLGHGPWPSIAGALAEPIELAPGVVDVRRGHGAPETLGGEVDGLLHAALAVAPPGRTGDHARPVVLGHGHEARLDDPALRGRRRSPCGQNASVGRCLSTVTEFPGAAVK